MTSETIRENLTLGAAEVKAALGRFGKAVPGLVPIVDFQSLVVEPNFNARTLSVKFEMEVEFVTPGQVIEELRDAFERGIKTLPVRNHVLLESFGHAETDTEVS